MPKPSAQLNSEQVLLNSLSDLKDEIGGTFATTAPITPGLKHQVISESMGYLATDPPNEKKVLRLSLICIAIMQMFGEDYRQLELYKDTFGQDT